MLKKSNPWVGFLKSAKSKTCYNEYKEIIKPKVEPMPKVELKPKVEIQTKTIKPRFKDEKEIIYKYWDTDDIGILLSQNNSQLTQAIENLMKREPVIHDSELLKLTKKYNDHLLKKLGPDKFFEGLENIVMHVKSYSEKKPSYFSSFFDVSQRMPIPKGSMSEKMRLRLSMFHENRRMKYI